MAPRETEDVMAEAVKVGDELPYRGKVVEIRTISTVLMIKTEGIPDSIGCRLRTLTKNRYAPVTRYKS